MNIREEVYKRPLLVKYIRFLYHDILEGIFNGYYMYMINYTFCIKKGEIDALKNLGFEEIKPYKSRAWRRGTELDKAHRRYYSAKYNNTLSFIKVAKNDKTIQNEINVAERIHNKEWPFTPKTLMTKSSFGGGCKMLAITFEENLHSIPDDASTDEIKSYIKEFLFIHKSLSEAKLVHADIHRGNMMLNSDNHLILFDFGISKFLDMDNEIDYVARPGTFYQKTKDGRLYDDAYSFICMIDSLSAHLDVLDCEEYREVKDRIGLSQFEVKL